MAEKVKVRTCLWFTQGGHKAAQFYVSLLPESRIDSVAPTGNPDDTAADPMVVEFTLAGAPMMILTAGPHYKLTPAVSISVLTDSQAETDRLWAALTADGGEESRCGWLTDRFGVSWQIVPRRMMELFASDDAAAAGRAQSAMLQMGKIDIAAIEAAFTG
jgi:predicted 3-demethylubiquinone-9 3-methyltransferase (glyoxalase superfamily)